MKKVAVALIIVASLWVSGCSRTKIIPLDQANMNGVNFINSTATIAAGKPVKFIDSPDGATHILVVGSNGIWLNNANAPKEINSSTGLTIAPGKEIDVVFMNPGTYTVTCTIHQSMLLTVTVTQ